MGLDMYLTGKRYMATWIDEADAERQTAIQTLFPELANIPSTFGDRSPVREIRIEAGYWRKANAIHNWFVHNVQGGEDKCRPHPVSREQLTELKVQCERAIGARGRDFEEETSEDILPTANGFFFGTTEYDDWYYATLAQTIEIVDRCLAMPDAWEFEYCSSW
jgi:hypothetical protein